MVKPNSSLPSVSVSAPEPEPDPSTPDRILDAAHRVFLRRGTAGARTQEIAAEAGVNKALVHYYFGTKEALAEAVFQRVASVFLPSIFAVLAAPDLTLEERINRVAERQVAFHRAHPYMAIYLLSEIHTVPERLEALVGPHGRPSLAPLQAQLDAAAAAGTIRPTAVSEFLVNLMSLLVFPVVARPMIRHVVGMSESEYDRFLDQRAAQAVSFFLAGLRP
jgi:TetR/AcrR family transcriptional regulator